MALDTRLCECCQQQFDPKDDATLCPDCQGAMEVADEPPSEQAKISPWSTADFRVCTKCEAVVTKPSQFYGEGFRGQPLVQCPACGQVFEWREMGTLEGMPMAEGRQKTKDKGFPELKVGFAIGMAAIGWLIQNETSTPFGYRKVEILGQKINGGALGLALIIMGALAAIEAVATYIKNKD